MAWRGAASGAAACWRAMRRVGHERRLRRVRPPGGARSGRDRRRRGLHGRQLARLGPLGEVGGHLAAPASSGSTTPRSSHQAANRCHCDAYVIRVLPASAAAAAEATRVRATSSSAASPLRRRPDGSRRGGGTPHHFASSIFVFFLVRDRLFRSTAQVRGIPVGTGMLSGLRAAPRMTGCRQRPSLRSDRVHPARSATAVNPLCGSFAALRSYG